MAIIAMFEAAIHWRHMEVTFSPETQAKLNRIAAEQGREPEALVREAVERLVDGDSWFFHQVDEPSGPA